MSTHGLGILKGVVVAPSIPGCTNPIATNYDPSATVDDGSCQLGVVVMGCMQPTAFDYNPVATQEDPNNPCTWVGCTDITAFNYNANDFNDAYAYSPTPTLIDDGSCIPTVAGCMDPASFNYNAAANVDDGSCIAVVNGCTYPTATSNYNISANTDDGTCIWSFCLNPLDSAYNSAYALVSSSYSAQSSSYGAQNAGCVDGGCIDASAINYDPSAVYDNGSCYYCSSFNISFLSVFQDTSVSGVNDGQIAITTASTDNDPYTYQITETTSNTVYTGLGAANSNTTNFIWNNNLNQIFDTGSVLFLGLPVGTYEILVTSLDGCQFTLPPVTISVIPPVQVFGCMDVMAQNYNPQANQPNNSCIYLGCDDPQATNFGEICSPVDYNGNTIPPGTFAPTGAGMILCNPSNCIIPPPPCSGCTDPNAINYQSILDPNSTCTCTATVDDGSCWDCNDLGYTQLYPEGFDQHGWFRWKHAAYYNNANNVGNAALYAGASGHVELVIKNAANFLGVYNFIGAHNGPWSYQLLEVTDPNNPVIAFAGTINAGQQALQGGIYQNITRSHNAQGDLFLQNVPPGVYRFNAINQNGCSTGPNTNSVYTVAIQTFNNNPENSCAFGTTNGSNMGEFTVLDGVLGCTDSTANNYNSNATVDDGSCVYPPSGCMDTSACNYDPVAQVNNQAACIFPTGCGDSIACNYDPMVSCNLTATQWQATGLCVYPEGCNDPTACNYDDPWSGPLYTSGINIGTPCDDSDTDCTYSSCGPGAAYNCGPNGCEQVDGCAGCGDYVGPNAFFDCTNACTGSSL